MKRNKWFWAGWTALCMACLMSACGGKEEKKVSLGNSKGLPGELLLIVDPSLWKTDARDSLEGVFKGSVPALPQHEPMFRMMRIFPENYSAKFSTLRNIVEVREDPKVENVEMGVAYNVKAAPQVYVSIKAHDAAALNCFLSEYRERLTGYFVEGELRWEGALLKKKYSAMVDKASREIFGWSVKTPSGIRSMKRAEDFLWASTDLPDQDMNYVCYALPLADSARMLTERWVELRDSVMKRNIPGAKPENWMTTTYENGQPLVVQRRVVLPDGREAYEMRGSGGVRRGALGRPVVSRAFPDPEHGRLLVAEGFIYSPKSKKRDLVRRMEAALRTLAPVR